MAIERDVTSGADARAHRRWIIGIAITVVFGMFGAVMALLAYTKMEPGSGSSQRGRSGAARPASPATGSVSVPAADRPVAPPAPTETPAAPVIEAPGKGKGHGRE